MTYITKLIKVVINYFHETYLNKLIALALVGIGMVPVIIERDITFLVLMLMFAMPLFVTNKDLRTWEP